MKLMVMVVMMMLYAWTCLNGELSCTHGDKGAQE